MIVSQLLDKAYRTTPPGSLPDQPVSALHGLSEADAAALRTHLGIETVADLATNRFVVAAQMLVAARAEDVPARSVDLTQPPSPGDGGHALCRYSRHLLESSR